MLPRTMTRDWTASFRFQFDRMVLDFWNEFESIAQERTIVRATTPELNGLHAPPTCADFARYSPAELGRVGLGARRASALVRLCRTLELERGLGPWSVGVVCVEGLGRYEFGLYRDLGLAKLASALWGRWVEADESDELLAPYGDWSGLASVYLLAGYARGFVPLPLAA